MNTLFTVVLVVELLFGLGFMAMPSTLVGLFGVTLSGFGVTLAWLFGSALIAFAVLLWCCKFLTISAIILLQLQSGTRESGGRQQV